MSGRDIDWREVTRLVVVWLIVAVAVGFVVGVLIYIARPGVTVSEEIAGAVVAAVVTVIVGLLRIVDTVLGGNPPDEPEDD